MPRQVVRSQTVPRLARRAPGHAGSVLLVLVLAGCGVPLGNSLTTVPATTAAVSASPSIAPTATGGASSALRLACTVENTVHPIDTISTMVSCTVSHAPGSETAFAVQYRARQTAHLPTTPSPTCHGALSGGSGRCTMTFSAPAQAWFVDATVAGSTQPHSLPLGPVTPTMVPAPTGTPALHFP
jgi:hypothetical protein